MKNYMYLLFAISMVFLVACNQQASSESYELPDEPEELKVDEQSGIAVTGEAKRTPVSEWTCIDSGTVINFTQNGISRSRIDRCFNERGGVDYLCIDEHRAGRQRLVCEDDEICQYGRCITLCTDSDRGISPGLGATVISEYGEDKDRCLDDKRLREAYCGTLTWPTAEIITCENRCEGLPGAARCV